MAIAAGTRIGPYEITAPIGAGGMGEVYRARDAKLNRDVAIKVLPLAFAADRERVARFEREAQTLASLNHPNIAHIYGIEQNALVMELVDGEDLSQRIARGALPVAEALPIARQIADALEAAHERGIIHRDLKPANIKVRDDGTVKVLDFGLAKALDATGGSNPDLMNSPTFTSPAVAGTMQGTILGTASYMAPEQAKGYAVDKRADIWAFGCVLYEMLTGARPFGGQTVAETIAAVIRADADMAAVDRVAPPRIRRVIDLCLRKDPRARLRDIGDARHILDERDDDRQPGPAAGRIRALLPWALTAVILVAALVAWPRGGPVTGGPVPVRRFAIDVPWHSGPGWDDFDVAMSPTAGHIAYYGRRPNENYLSVYVRPLDSLEGVPLGNRRAGSSMTFSADGEWMGLVGSRGLYKVSIHGGKEQPLARIERGFGASWGRDGAIIVGHRSGLLRAPSAGGAAAPVTRVDAAAGETGHFEPHLLPSGTHVLMRIARGEDSELAIADLSRTTYERLGLAGRGPAYLPSGHLVFRQGGTVMAAGFDLQKRRVTSEAVPVLDNVHRGPYVAADGTMAYVPERSESTAQLVWVDRRGQATPIEGERLNYSHLSLGGGGRQALLNLGTEVFVRDLERGTRRLLSRGALFPIWSADGRWATYGARDGGLFTIVRRPADGSGGPETLVTSKDAQLVPTSWNPRTGELAYSDEASDIWILKPGGTPTRLLSSSANERSGVFSPDGRWLAYVSDETGAYQVYVVPYPGPGPKLAISVDGGMAPIWSANGRELFFRRGGRVLSAAMTYSPSLAAGRPVELFNGAYTFDFGGHQRYDVASDGRFLMVEDAGDFRAIVVEGWSEEVKRLVARGNKQ